MKSRYVLALAAASLVGGCTTTVTGTAQPVPGRFTVAPAAATDPCALLTDDEAVRLGFGAPGTRKAARPESLIPPSCTWSTPDPNDFDDSLQAIYSTDLSIGRYYSAQPTGEEQFGGVTWEKHPSPIGDFICDLAVELSAKSFVALSSQNVGDPSKACELAEKAAPIVARHLPK